MIHLAPLVELLKVEIICPTRPAGNIVLDIKKKLDNTGGFKVDESYVLKEKSVNCMSLTF
jgi:hypothetical protein